jgi:hypothetical protein
VATCHNKEEKETADTLLFGRLMRRDNVTPLGVHHTLILKLILEKLSV